MLQRVLENVWTDERSPSWQLIFQAPPILTTSCRKLSQLGTIFVVKRRTNWYLTTLPYSKIRLKQTNGDLLVKEDLSCNHTHETA